MDNIQNEVVEPKITVVNSEVKYAGFWIRWVALIVDNFIVSVAMFIFIFAMVSIWGLSGLAKDVSSVFGVLSKVIGFGIPFVILLSFLIPWIYFIVMTNKKGATLGKKILGLKVVSETGEKLSLGKIILRETIGKFVSGLIFSIGFLMAAFTEKKQGLHDKMAGSLVVYEDPNKSQNNTVIIIVALVAFLFIGIAIIGILSSVVLASLSTAREKANDAVVRFSVASSTVESLQYVQVNNTLKGFTSSVITPECSGPLVINISPDGSAIATFGKSCTDSTSYYCQSYSISSTSLDQVSTVKLDSIPKDKFDCK